MSSVSTDITFKELVLRKRKQEIYYELYTVVSTNNIAVVVTLRQIGNGKLHFYGIRYKRKKTIKR